jgi:transposase
MNDQLKAVIEELPDKPPRSRLEHYKEFIEELRRRGHTYKDIAIIFAEKFGICITAAGVHDFIRRRRQANSKPRPKGNEGMPSRVPRPMETESATAGRTAVAQDAQTFKFDPDEPLRLTKPTKP